MKKLLPYIILIIFCFATNLTQAQQFTRDVKLHWRGIVTEEVPGVGQMKYLYFTDAEIDPANNLPVYSTHYRLNSNASLFDLDLLDEITEVISGDEKQVLVQSGYSNTEFSIHHEIYYERKQAGLVVKVNPIRFNESTGEYEKLVSFNIIVDGREDYSQKVGMLVKDYAENSVLDEGEWVKIRVSEDGIYKISYSDLQSYGIDPSTIDPTHLKLYGNAGGLLPERNSDFRYDDLQENAIFISGESDGSFDESDYILFYGMSPHTWELQLNYFLRQIHYYDDFNYYYLSPSQEPGLRINIEETPTGDVTSAFTTFNDFQVHEDELQSLIESGKTWYGDEFGETNSRSYQFHFPNIVPGTAASVKTSVANKTYVNDLLVVDINGMFTDSVTLTSIDVNSTKFAQKKKRTSYCNDLPPNIEVKLDYFPAENGSWMWLNYIHVNAESYLKLENGQLGFRNLDGIMEGAIHEFSISNSQETTRVWDITNPIQPLEMTSETNSSTTTFKAQAENLREFFAFDGSTFKKPEFVGSVDNQNLHALAPFDMLILTHELFLDQANQLAQLHEEHDGLKVIVLTPDIIYNEFSSGKQDPTAIRDFLKLFYDKYEDQEPRFLLLFGDGSFDLKDRIEHNTNFIPTFQTSESLVTSTSYVVDDYFGILDDDEGHDATGYLDVGIGRLPVTTAEQAQQMVDKILRYLKPEEPQFGKWRTRLSMIADDQDGNLHIEQADSLSNGVTFVTPPLQFNQTKIYLDAYPQLNTPSGHRYPEVTEKINEQVRDGALIINYIGHGGTGGWAHERILQQNDMMNWTNENKLPMFITATCEFSRFDEPEIVSGGELVILNPIGGGIALFTTTRLAYSQSNYKLNQRIYARAFTPVNGEMPYLGDLIRESKPPGQMTTRNFVLLGDPAVKLSYPKHNIITSKINGEVLNESMQDTILSLQKITVEGEIESLSGDLVDDFNGILYPVLYDKTTKYKTIGNDYNSFAVDFYNQDKIVWEGKSTVIDGKFSFTFVVPRDIALNFGEAKFSYYAFSDKEDASGYFNDIILGGIDADAEQDNQGPEIDLYINDTTFVSGNLTHENPSLLAFVSDVNGINSSQNGIGHSMTLVLDENYSDVMVMNPYFEISTDDYRSGSLNYDFFDLPNGKHTLTLKAWDSYNNSSEKSIEFVIDRTSKLNLSEVKNFPNPFVEKTTFTFKHTRPGDDLDIELTIFDITGRYVLSYRTYMESTTTEVPFLTWDGRDVNGAKMPQGVYIYTVYVKDELGQETIIRQKMILGY